MSFLGGIGNALGGVVKGVSNTLGFTETDQKKASEAISSKQAQLAANAGNAFSQHLGNVYFPSQQMQQQAQWAYGNAVNAPQPNYNIRNSGTGRFANVQAPNRNFYQGMQTPNNWAVNNFQTPQLSGLNGIQPGQYQGANPLQALSLQQGLPGQAPQNIQGQVAGAQMPGNVSLQSNVQGTRLPGQVSLNQGTGINAPQFQNAPNLNKVAAGGVGSSVGTNEQIAQGYGNMASGQSVQNALSQAAQLASRQGEQGIAGGAQGLGVGRRSSLAENAQARSEGSIQSNLANQLMGAQQAGLAGQAGLMAQNRGDVLNYNNANNANLQQNFANQYNAAGFGNQAQLAQQAGNLNVANAGFGQNLAQGQFTNQALLGQQAGNLGVANSQFGQNLAQGQFANQAAGQQFGQNLAAGQFGNQAMMDQATINAGLQNQAYNQQMGLGTGMNAQGIQQYGMNLGTAQAQDLARQQGFQNQMGLAGANQGVTQQNFANQMGLGQARLGEDTTQFGRDLAQSQFQNQMAQQNIGNLGQYYGGLSGQNLAGLGLLANASYGAANTGLSGYNNVNTMYQQQPWTQFTNNFLTQSGQMGGQGAGLMGAQAGINYLAPNAFMSVL